MLNLKYWIAHQGKSEEKIGASRLKAGRTTKNLNNIDFPPSLDQLKKLSNITVIK